MTARRVDAVDRLAPEPVEQVELGPDVEGGGAGIDPVGVVGHGVERSVDSTMAGKTSRSIDTRRSGAMRSSTEGSST